MSSEHWRLEDEAKEVGSVRPFSFLNVMVRIFVSTKVKCKSIEHLKRGNDIIRFAF